MNGVTLLSQLSGPSEAEIQWTWDRLKALMAEGKTQEEAKAVIAAEVKNKPWESGS